MRHVRPTRILLALSLTAGVARGADVVLPESEAGRRVAAYFEASNAGDPGGMERFMAENFTPGALKSRPPAERVARWKEMHRNLGSLTPLRTVVAKDDRIEVEVRCGNGDVPTFTFEHEAAPPHKLIAIGARLEAADGPRGPSEVPPQGPDEWLQSLTAQDKFSGVVVARRAGKTVFEKAYGLAERSTGTPNTLGTRFNLGSMNKEMTKIAIARLAEQGKIKPTDTIDRFLPDYPNHDAATRVTVAELVEHTSGIGDFFNDRFEATPHSSIRALSDYLRLFADKPLEFAPGTQSRYSNGGYVVLGLIVAKAAGMPYEEFIREAILDPAGMKDTGWISVDEIVPARAVGYTRHGDAGGPPEGTLRTNTYTLPGRGSSAGGGYSTAGDIVKLAEALQGGALLTKPWAEWVLAGKGAPWPEPASKDAPHGRIGGGNLGIAGGAPGVSAAMEWDLDRDTIVVVLANLDPPTAPATARAIATWLESAP